MGLRGLSTGINGLWTFMDIDEGDYVSFLYGAKVKNLYKVIKKVAYRNAENLPPWPSVTFKMSGNTYYFPFRLYLKPERHLNEPMIRAEFAYVAENLLLRGGYRKTHFQADGITLHSVSNMGSKYDGKIEELKLNAEPFIPKIVFKRDLQNIPERFHFKELLLQSMLRKKLKNTEILKKILDKFRIEHSPDEFEVLGEKALPEGYVDIFIKLRLPLATNKYILVEVKTGKVRKKDLEQLRGYISEFGNEAVGGVIIGRDYPKKMPEHKEIVPVVYHFENLDREKAYAYEELLRNLKLEII